MQLVHDTVERMDDIFTKVGTLPTSMAGRPQYTEMSEVEGSIRTDREHICLVVVRAVFKGSRLMIIQLNLKLGS
jgi:hypothetical protein